MRRSLFSLLLLVFGLLAFVPPGVRAATLHDNGYASVGVPNLRQAVKFFQDVLDCRVIGSPSMSSVQTTSAPRLLSCDAGSIIELFAIPPSSAPTAPAQPLQFVSADVRHADKWLRRQGARVSGAPHRLTFGPLAGRMVLDFVAPWGLRLQLVDSGARRPSGTRLATANASFDRH
ncbi:MAG TPA: VOC family protein [Rhodanobacter sp.]|nr:VOC family protein [Rhodanobacter sp.]